MGMKIFGFEIRRVSKKIEPAAFKDGDIVEILSVSQSQFDSMWHQQCLRREEAEARVRGIIGMKFKIHKRFANWDKWQMVGWSFGGHFDGEFQEYQFRKA